MVKRLSLLVLITAMLTSCVSTKRIHYFRDLNTTDTVGVAAKNFETVIRPDDNLIILVSAIDQAAAEPFNLPVAANVGAIPGNLEQASSQLRFQTYLVDHNGDIAFPVLGKIKVGGVTKEKVLENLQTKLRQYIKDPVINLRIVNYKVSVFGEVTRPGSFTIPSERITLPEALSMAGDLTIYGDRREILLLRDVEGVKTHYIIDLTKGDLINSPCFYLQQNDQIYVKPNKVRSNSAAVGPNTTVIISSISLLLTTIALLTR